MRPRCAVKKRPSKGIPRYATRLPISRRMPEPRSRQLRPRSLAWSIPRPAGCFAFKTIPTRLTQYGGSARFRPSSVASRRPRPCSGPATPVRKWSWTTPSGPRPFRPVVPWWGPALCFVIVLKPAYAGPTRPGFAWLGGGLRLGSIRNPGVGFARRMAPSAQVRHERASRSDGPAFDRARH